MTKCIFEKCFPCRKNVESFHDKTLTKCIKQIIKKKTWLNISLLLPELYVHLVEIFETHDWISLYTLGLGESFTI